MAGSNRRFARGAILLPVLFLTMAGLARATTITVNSLADMGTPGICVLRDAITASNSMTATNGCAAGSGTDTINFSVTGTIMLGSALPAIANASPGSLTIDGIGQAIKVDGANLFQILSVTLGSELKVQNLTIADGRAGIGGGIRNDGTLTVNNSDFSDNSAAGIFGDGGGIDNGGTLTVNRSTFSGNSAVDGGGIFNVGTLTVSNSTFSDNSVSGSPVSAPASTTAAR